MSNADIAVARRKALMAGAMGNIVEYYDFFLYGVFATTIAHLFFPQSDATVGLLATFAIFAVGYVARPLGAIAFGHFGDRVGRRPTLIASVMLMSASTVALGILPTHAQAGVLAPVLLLVCRLAQGFSAGGEFTSSSIFVIEHAPKNQRGRYASYMQLSVIIGVLCGLLVSVSVTTSVTGDQLMSWGWRLPFLAAGPLALVGLYLRLQVDESPVFAVLRAEGKVESAPIVEALKVAKKPMLIMIGFAMCNAVAFYLLGTFLVSYLTNTVEFTTSDSLVVQLVAMGAVVVGLVGAGRAIDRFGRKIVAVACTIGLGLWAIPAFVLIENSGLIGACLICAMYGLIFSGISATSALLIVDLFPVRVRASASSVSYQVAYTVFGGTAPYAATWLVGKGQLIGPAYYLVAVCVIAAVVAALGIGNRTTSNVARAATASDDKPQQAGVSGSPA